MENKMQLSPYSKIKVYWDDSPINYSKEAKTRIRNYFASKYGVNKNNINVVYRPVKINDKGERIEITGASIENIMDVNYQRALMKELLELNKTNIDFNRIVALDDKINGELSIDLTQPQHKSWEVRWISINNFLSFGDDNYVPFSKLKGLTVVNSTPQNQGGKTTLTIDAIKFLLHGNTTKTDKNEEIFNAFSNKNELSVRGMISIEGDEIIIERKLRRSAKKTGGWTVTNEVKYYELLPDGEERCLLEDDAIKTTKKIKETIGSEKDFEMLVLATEKNLDDLIGLTSGESGKLLTRLIGLEVLEHKEELARKKYNEFNGKKKSNDYDIVTLSNDIIEHENKIIECGEIEQHLLEQLAETKTKLAELSLENDRLINSKEKVDVTISALNPSKLDSDIALLTERGLNIKAKIDELGVKISEIGEIIFDEDRHFLLTKELSKLNSKKAVTEAEISRLRRVINDLIKGGICQSCNRKLDNVDNSEHIKKHESDVLKLSDELSVTIKEIDETTNELNGLNIVKSKIDIKNRLELDRDRFEVEIGGLRNQIVSKRNDLKKYNMNLDAIEHNRNVDISLSKIKTEIIVVEHSREGFVVKLERVRQDIQTNRDSIVTKNKLIETIKKEEEIEKIFKVYIDLVGKKGISKVVLRSVLPIINSEVQRLLEDVCDFDVEIFINEKNEVQLLMIKDEVTKPLKSASGFEKSAASLALRSVLGKVSTLPMPNFITFDEVLGKIAAENIEKMRLLFDKIKDMYDIVFLITHNDLVKDWSENLVTVVKDNNVSKVTIK